MNFGGSGGPYTSVSIGCALEWSDARVVGSEVRGVGSGCLLGPAFEKRPPYVPPPWRLFSLTALHLGDFIASSMDA